MLLIFCYLLSQYTYYVGALNTEYFQHKQQKLDVGKQFHYTPKMLLNNINNNYMTELDLLILKIVK